VQHDDPTARFGLAVLATWRIAHLVAEEDGPWNSVANLRARAGASQLGELMDCFYCLSLWAALPFAFASVPRRRDVPLTWLALSGAACLLERTTSIPEKGAWNVLWEAPASGGGPDTDEARKPAHHAGAAPAAA
jgi:hypothetical protein